MAQRRFGMPTQLERGTDRYSGRDLEADVLGTPKFDKKRYRDLLANNQEPGGFVARGKIIRIIRDAYTGDPANPEKDAPQEVLINLRELLGFEDDEDIDRVRFYSAVGTPLDIFHGTDGWFEIKTDNGSLIEITVDITQNTNLDLEEAKRKADLILVETSDPSLLGTVREIKEIGTQRILIYGKFADSNDEGFLDSTEKVADALKDLYEYKILKEAEMQRMSREKRPTATSWRRGATPLDEMQQTG